jgi:hypothetical protein
MYSNRLLVHGNEQLDRLVWPTFENKEHTVSNDPRTCQNDYGCTAQSLSFLPRARARACVRACVCYKINFEDVVTEVPKNI